MLGVDQKEIQKQIQLLVPDYMAMGERGMADMGEMQMPLPDNTLPMMSGKGQFGSLEMGGMFTTVKIRDGIAKHDYRDPGDYPNPPGTYAREVETDVPPVERMQPSSSSPDISSSDIELKVRKPNGHGHH
jgi:hypothetical protein